jgi:uncharacterized repeat protein (TIGR03833 family)
MSRSILVYLYEQQMHFSRANIHPGSEVLIVLKKDQKFGILTKGKVKDLLTSKSYHTRGIKVRLHDGQVGRVQKILKEAASFGTPDETQMVDQYALNNAKIAQTDLDNVSDDNIKKKLKKLNRRTYV